MHEIIREITESNRWRDGEFAMFKTNLSDVDQNLWCRMCIPMIYAHWEGFVVSSLRILLKYLNSLKLDPSKVTTNIVVVGLGSAYRPLSGKQSFSQRVDFTEKFGRLFSEDLKFESKIDTKSNLNSKVLKELCEAFSFSFDLFDSCISDVDRLVNIRNSIAHGENSIVPDMKNIEKYISSVNEAIDILTNEISNFVEREEYLSNAVA